MLSKGSLYFSSLQSFDDGREGQLTARTAKRFFESQYAQYGPSYNAVGAMNQYLAFQKDIYANCWHMNQEESYLMWKAYASRGIAIKTNFERACASFEAFTGTVSGGVVDYIDFSRQETSIGNIFIHAVTKDSPYMDEKEFRFLTWRQELMNQNLKFGEKGQTISIDIDMLVEKIYIRPFHPKLPQYLTAIIHRLGFEGRIASSSILYSPSA